MLEDFRLDHLYCVVASNVTLTNVVSAVSREELEAGIDHMRIGEVYGYYSNNELKRYSTYWHKDGITLFDEITWSGIFYTGALPVKNAEGKTIALLCMDVSVTNLTDLIKSYIVPIVIMLLVICALFTALLIFWLRRQVVAPVGKLEASVRRFADSSHRMKDVAGLKLDLPEIHTKNEVESLALAIDKMSADMTAYVRDILSAETRAQHAEKEAQDMTLIAYRDALTRVKSKAAYNLKAAELAQRIAAGDARFGIVMVDLNNLKAINDTLGHDKGDAYLVGACQQVCRVYAHSPVYRIGGDEFLVILEGSDYGARDERYRELTEKFMASRADADRPLWECYSAAGGMAVFEAGRDASVEDVFRRADVAMYADKQAMKQQAAHGEIVDRTAGMQRG